MNRQLLAFRAFPVVLMAIMLAAGQLANTLFGEGLSLLAQALAPAAAYVGMRTFGAMQRRAWWFLLLGQVMWLVTSALYSCTRMTGRTAAVSLAGHDLHVTTIFALLGYICFALALLTIGRTIEPEHRGSSTVDAGLIVLGLGSIALTLVTWPAIHATGLSFTPRVEAVYIPFADIAMVAAGARSFTAPGQRGLSVRMLLTGSCMVAVRDIVDQACRMHGWHNSVLTAVTTVALYIAVLVLAMAPLHPSMRDLRTIPTRQHQMHVARLALLIIALLAPWMVLLGQARSGSGPIVWTVLIAVAQSGLAITRMRRIMADQRAHTRALHVAARTDHLTQLPNRRHLEEELARLAAGPRSPVALAILDLDHFKRVNDELGHQAGDELLCNVATIWSALLNEEHAEATLARMGGEEFLLLLPETSQEAAESVIARLRAAMPDGRSFSAGLTAWMTDDDPHLALGAADAALYRAKAGGRARTVVTGAGAAGRPTPSTALPTA